MNRTDRLYAVVEELRAVAPQPRSARQLAERFEVSTRTIERDIDALLQAGLPIYATAGRRGGYAIDRAHTLPPINFTAAEATALALAIARPGASPFAESLRSALHKVLEAMPTAGAQAAQSLAGRVHLFEHETDHGPATARTIEQAVLHRQVVEIGYEDRHGVVTARQVEPMAVVGSGEAWYLVGFCRLRQDQRVFRLDRIHDARVTGEAVTQDREPNFEGGPRAIRPLSLPR
jgi:predicted DNA-binding transcriptional regulator YafY